MIQRFLNMTLLSKFALSGISRSSIIFFLAFSASQYWNECAINKKRRSRDRGKTSFRFVLDEKALENVLGTAKSPEMPLAVISTVGAFRTGKSFLQSVLFKYLEKLEAESNPWENEEFNINNCFKFRGGKGKNMNKKEYLWRFQRARDTRNLLLLENFHSQNKNSGTE